MIRATWVAFDEMTPFDVQDFDRARRLWRRQMNREQHPPVPYAANDRKRSRRYRR